MPAPTIRKYEAGLVDSPGRGNITALAAALDWPGGLNVALALVGEAPLSAEEQQWLPAPVDLFADVTRIWPDLTPRIQAAVWELLQAICEPQGPHRRQNHPTGRDPAATVKTRVVGAPREPSLRHDEDGPIDRSRSEYRPL